jgi:hypothetical protein
MVCLIQPYLQQLTVMQQLPAAAGQLAVGYMAARMFAQDVHHWAVYLAFALASAAIAGCMDYSRRLRWLLRACRGGGALALLLGCAWEAEQAARPQQPPGASSRCDARAIAGASCEPDKNL